MAKTAILESSSYFVGRENFPDLGKLLIFLKPSAEERFDFRRKLNKK